MHGYFLMHLAGIGLLRGRTHELNQCILEFTDVHIALDPHAMLVVAGSSSGTGS